MRSHTTSSLLKKVPLNISQQRVFVIFIFVNFLQSISKIKNYFRNRFLFTKFLFYLSKIWPSFCFLMNKFWSMRLRDFMQGGKLRSLWIFFFKHKNTYKLGLRISHRVKQIANIPIVVKHVPTLVPKPTMSIGNTQHTLQYRALKLVQASSPYVLEAFWSFIFTTFRSFVYKNLLLLLW